MEHIWDYDSIGIDASRDGFLTINYVDVTPITIDTIQDDGRLSSIIDNYCKKYNVAVVPFALTDILVDVKSLERYDLIRIEGELFASSKQIRENVVEDYKKEIMRSLQGGMPFRLRLMDDMQFDERVHRTLCLSKVEWEYLASLFRNYNPYIKKETGNLIFSVGARRNE